MRRLIVAIVAGFAIGLIDAPAARTQEVLNQLEAQLRGAQPVEGAEPGFLGLLAETHNEAGAGIRVLDVMPGGPAQQAGVKVGDLITSVDGNPTRSMEDFARALSGSAPGRRVKLQIKRDTGPAEIEVAMGRRPNAAAPAVAPPNGQESRPLLGLRLATLTPDLQLRLKVPSPVGAAATGVVVVGVMQGSPAEQAGIPLEAVIVMINGKPVQYPNDVAQFLAEIGAGNEATLTYYSNGERFERRVKLDAQVSAPQPPANALTPPPTAPLQSLDSPQVFELKKRVEQLEQRVRELEATVRAIAPAPRADK
jgi:S1-C subfamily serine protease